MSNIKYAYKWKGSKTQWEYLLEIIPADPSPLNNPQIIELPTGFLKNMNFSYKYDKFPLGFPETPTLSTSFDFGLIPNSPEFDDLKKALFDPVITTTFIIDMVPIEVQLGTLFVLYIKDPRESNYYPIFRGIYRTHNKIKYELLDKTLNIESYDLNRCILDTFNFDYLPQYSLIQEGLDNPPEDTTMPFELIIIQNDVFHLNPDFYFRFRKHNFIFQYIKWIGEKIKQLMTRSSSETFDVPSTTLPRLFKQLSNGTGQLGEGLNPDNIYHIAQVIKGNDEVGGLYSQYDENSLLNRYKNSVWDFVKEYAEWKLSRGRFHWFGIGFLPPLGTPNIYEIQDIIEIKDFELFSNVVKTATSSLYEQHHDDNYADIDKFQSTKRGSYNETEIAIPMVFNNIPSAVKYKQLAPGQPQMVSFFPHITGLYYKDQPGAFPIFIRVHEYAEWEIKSDYYSSSLPGCGFVPFDWNRLPITKISDVIAASQVETGMPKWISRVLLTLFSNNKQTSLKITVPLDKITNFDLNLLPWLDPATINIQFDLTQIDENINIGTNKWAIIECNVDFSNEIAELGLLSIFI